jgi:hypothetical protein
MATGVALLVSIKARHTPWHTSLRRDLIDVRPMLDVALLVLVARAYMPKADPRPIQGRSKKI